MIWSWNALPIQSALVSASGLLLAAIGLIVLLRRGPWLTTLLFASAFLSLAALEAGQLALLHAETAAAAAVWAAYLARVSALASWLWLTLSVVLGRPEPRRQIRDAGAYLALSLAGVAVMFVVGGSPAVLGPVVRAAADVRVALGPLGRIYLMYLVVAMVVVLMNLESMLRTAPASAQVRLRPLFLGILVAILAELLVVSGGLLAGGMRASWMSAAAPVLFVSGSAAALALARRRLSDMSVPVARPVIYYSSVSLTLAGAFMLTMVVLSRLVPVLAQSWRLGVTVAFLVFVGGGALILMLSPATSRAIKRFVDRNFYANRYDYRREWERVSAALSAVARPEEVCRQIEQLAGAVFDAGGAAIHFRDDPAAPLRLLYGPPGAQPELAADHPLAAHLAGHRLPVVFRDLEADLDLIPCVVESRPTIAALHAAVCAPLTVGDRLVGLLWLSDKRADEAWTWEDLEFLAAMSRQLAAALWSSRQAEAMAESRQLESLHRLSSFVLHDIKNQVSGLSLVVDNARRHLGNPEFQRDALAVVERTVRSLKELMNQVAGVARAPQLQPAPCALRELVDEALLEAGMSAGEADGVRLEVRVEDGAEAVLDRRHVARVLVNLLVNAREALSGPGAIELRAGLANGGGRRVAELSVRDSGRGMSEEFVRTRLFRPFATTKRGGLGIGLAQCRGIVDAHGGSIEVCSRAGEGTTFTVRLPAAPVAAPAAAAPAAEPRSGARA